MNMSKIIESGRIAFLIAVLSICALGKPIANTVVRAPVPTQIASAKKIFISNAGEERDAGGDLVFSGGPDRAYNQFYAAIAGLGRYKMVGAPADADLILKIHLVGDGLYYMLRLEILDPGSHTELWMLEEHALAREEKTGATLDRAMNLLVNDFKELVARPAASANAQAK